MAKTILSVFPGVVFISKEDMKPRAAINPNKWLKDYEKQQSKAGVK